MAGETILVVDNDHSLLRLMKIRLEAAGYKVLLASSGEEALTRSHDSVCDLAIVDLQMAGMDGLTLLQELLRQHADLPVMILTAHGTIASAVEATKRGAYDYITKPFDAKDLLHRIDKALEVHRLKGEVAQLRTFVQERYHFDNIIASSAVMQQILRQVAQIAATDSAVALYGESGTGKELIAKAIHAAGRRSRGPFVALNCGAIPEGLLENELFGHVKGAYTGADQARGGLLQQAHGGTLFLDEVADLALPLQVKFLRVLQEREFYPLGAGQPTKVDFRLIVATNRDLWQAVSDGEFREDLYYRIHVIPIFLPPLRERQEDIPLLAQHLLQRLSQELAKAIRGFTPEAMQLLLQHHWPGNVRELANVVERAVVLATQDVITPDVLLLGKPTAKTPQRALGPLKDAEEEFERGYLVQVLTATHGNVSQAAALAGKYRADFYKLLRKHRLDPATFKEGFTQSHP
jgi:two-component system, NtrC family, response regulator GlrR